MNSETPSTWGERDGKQERLGWASPVASGKTLHFPVAVDFQCCLVSRGLGAGDVGMAGGETADVGRLGLHWWEGEAPGHGCDKCPGLSSAGAPALTEGGCRQPQAQGCSRLMELKQAAPGCVMGRGTAAELGEGRAGFGCSDMGLRHPILTGVSALSHTSWVSCWSGSASWARMRVPVRCQTAGRLSRRRCSHRAQAAKAETPPAAPDPRRAGSRAGAGCRA